MMAFYIKNNNKNKNMNECKHFREIHFIGRLSSNDDNPIFLLCILLDFPL